MIILKVVIHKWPLWLMAFCYCPAVGMSSDMSYPLYNTSDGHFNSGSQNAHVICMVTLPLLCLFLYSQAAITSINTTCCVSS